MIQEAQDFLEESRTLHALVEPLQDVDYMQPTQFKGWTVNNVLQHLHFFNLAAAVSLDSAERFDVFYAELNQKRAEGMSSVQAFDHLLKGLRGQALLERWRQGFEEMAARFAQTDAKKRVRWVALDMSARSSLSARLMETWAHGQEIYDLLGVARVNTDRIRSIATIGVNTYGWTFRNRGEDAPEPRPHVRLTAPSGAVWQWNECSEENRVEGLAEEFCQVVTQVRNIQDTGLRVVGEPATRWMTVAQCFAWPVETPPPPGTRGPHFAGAGSNATNDKERP